MEKDNPTDTISCPFCMSHEFTLKSGRVSCPVCFTDFDITDGGECLFINARKLRIPIKGVFCKKCRLFQYEKGETCLNCGAEISIRKKNANR